MTGSMCPGRNPAAAGRFGLRRDRAVILLFAGLLFSGPVRAQTQFLEPPQPGQERVPSAPVSKPGIDFQIEAPRRTPVPRASEDLVFDVIDIVIDGSTVYPAAELREFVAPLIGKPGKLADLLGASERIEKKYHDDGYVLTRVYLPHQSVENGRFRIEVAEGYVAGVSVDGGDEGVRQWVERSLAPVLASKPLRIAVLEDALLAANEAPGVSVSGLLRPSATEAKASDLVVSVNAPLYTGSVAFDNRGSANTGIWTGSGNLAVRSPFDDGGQFQLSYSSAMDLNERRAAQARYALPSPIGPEGLLLSLGGLMSHGEPAGSVKSLKMISDSTSIGPRATYPLLRGRQEKLSLDGGLTVQASDVHIFGTTPLSHEEWRTLDIGLLYQNTHFLWGSADGTAVFAHGLPAFGATPPRNTSRPGSVSDFRKLSGTVHTVQPLSGGLSLSVQGQWQYSPSMLLVGEQVSFGGPSIGRGYDAAAVTGDNGVGGAMELRYDLAPGDFYLNDLGADTTQLYTFYDTGEVWLNNQEAAVTTINSVGAGMRLTVFQNFSINVEVAKSLTPAPSSDEGRRSLRGFFNGSVRF